jgi:hypothetical protein
MVRCISIRCICVAFGFRKIATSRECAAVVSDDFPVFHAETKSNREGFTQTKPSVATFLVALQLLIGCCFTGNNVITATNE